MQWHGVRKERAVSMVEASVGVVKVTTKIKTALTKEKSR